MFPKGGMGKMMKQAQELQAKMAKAQGELGDIHVEANSGGGMVKVSANGNKEITSVKINPEVLEEDIDLLEDLVLAATNQALIKASEAAEDKMQSITGGLMGNFKIPGM
ncbi:MAG: YbaB/EbfC family nucleoid-associated protein [Candidatus Marinimicrobia bacterium]|nr:YbaB/EbfC family nucleoid-associated protein [Candidatus Neomarinimicrobiota bacterium]|tara:strand:- start:3739 stop:4065 length:327 start_codon:yes stop_codon:yes gene_type:complete